MLGKDVVALANQAGLEIVGGSWLEAGRCVSMGVRLVELRGCGNVDRGEKRAVVGVNRRCI